MDLKSYLLRIGSFLAVLLLATLWVSGTPEYSIYQMFQAADQHDYRAFSHYVDVDDVARSTMETVFKQTTQDFKRFRGGWSDQRFMEIYLTQNKPILKEDVKFNLKRQVETDVFYTDYQPTTLYRAIRNIDVSETGHTAIATIIPSDNITALPPLNLRLRQVGWHWQIFEMQLQSERELKASGKKNL